MAVVIKWNNLNGSGTLSLETGKVYKVGRKEGNAIALDDKLCSSDHFEIQNLKKGIIRLKDLDSKNGVYLNGTKIQEENFYVTDELRAGETIFSIIASELTEEELDMLSFKGDTSKRLTGAITLNVEDVPYEPRGLRRTKNMIEETYSIPEEPEREPINLKKTLIPIIIIVAIVSVGAYWFFQRYRIIL